MTLPRMRSFLSRRRGAVSLTVVAVFLLACGTGSPSQPDAAATTVADQTTPAGTTGTTTAAAPTTSSAPVFTVDGIAPYTLGASLAGLDAGNKVDQVQVSTEVCMGNTTARGTGAYGDIRLSFRGDGKLYLVTNRGASIPTASGARVGMTYNELKSIYASMTHEELSQGGRKLYLVKAASGRGILFDIDSATGKVFTMSAADATFLRDSVVNGTDFC